MVSELESWTPAMSLIVSTTFFSLDQCAALMETPFGVSAPTLHDVEMKKTVRRIDKLTAAIIAIKLGEVVTHYNIFPDQQSTSREHERVSVWADSELVLRCVHAALSPEAPGGGHPAAEKIAALH